MTGGALPAGPVSEKVSVRHWVAKLIFFPVIESVEMLPPSSKAEAVVKVEGPAITNDWKSRRI